MFLSEITLSTVVGGNSMLSITSLSNEKKIIFIIILAVSFNSGWLNPILRIGIGLILVIILQGQCQYSIVHDKFVSSHPSFQHSAGL